ncbi:MAG: hypothetical protein JRG91_05755 [Deltaproteobacteria bacterium]|nr:hypothetical protein [Deltaproteobacteria bacterium]
MTRILRGRPILKPEYLKTLTTSRELIEAAEEAAGQIRAQAERRGLEDGLALAGAALAEAETRRAHWLDEARSDLATLSLQVASSLYARAREEDRSIVEGMCRKAIDQVAQARRIAVRINPRDVDALEGVTGARGAPIDIVQDGSITAGGCIVETDLGSVDGRLETRLDALRVSLEAVLERHAKKDA